MIQDEEARRFIGRCLQKAPDRPSATELLNDPFLCSTEEEASNLIMSPDSLPSPPVGPTNMTITGTMNQEDDTIFLKVQISDKKGPARNIFFPFEITSDTALDVAKEMVKEFEITDWEPSEIAGMIHNEITRLVPSWSNSECTPDEQDNSPHHPLYTTSSSHSSSQASLPDLFSSNDSRDWLQDEGDDTSSVCSDNYTNLSYDEECVINTNKEVICRNRSSQKCTRFGPEGSMSNGLDCSSKTQQRMMPRTASLVDIRSQLLHRTLVEEVNKRRMFNTVGTLDQVGYRQPDCQARNGKSVSRRRG